MEMAGAKDAKKKRYCLAGVIFDYKRNE